MKEPLPHQKEFLEWARDRDRVGIFFEMRLGKSFTAIKHVANRLGSRGHRLLIAPKPTLPGWEAELNDEDQPFFLPEGSLDVRSFRLRQFQRRLDWGWFCLNPEAVVKMQDVLEYDWDAVVIDESVGMSRPKTKFTRQVRRWLRSEVRVLLSGEPAPETIEQYFEQMAWLGEDDSFMSFSKYWPWRLKLFNQFGYEWAPKRKTQQRILKAVSERAYVLSAEDAGIVMPTEYQVRTVSLPGWLRHWYKQALKEFRIGDKETIWRPVVETWLCQLCGGGVPTELSGQKQFGRHKLNEVLHLLKTDLKKKQVVIYARFNREVRQIESALGHDSITCTSFTGRTSDRDRRNRVKQFNNGKYRVLVCQGRAVRFGLDFAAASHAIFYSNWWDLNTRRQLEARVRAMRKPGTVCMIDIVCEDTVDQVAVEALTMKKVTSTSALKRIKEYLRGQNDGSTRKYRSRH